MVSVDAGKRDEGAGIVSDATREEEGPEKKEEPGSVDIKDKRLKSDHKS